MTKMVYTADERIPFFSAISPVAMAKNLYAHQELIRAYAKREYEATYRATFLGGAWSLLTPLILLSLFSFVFGYIFQGRFNVTIQESPLDFAMALFIGLSLYTCIGTALTQSPTLMFSAATYVKTLDFPIEIIPFASTVNILKNLMISLGLTFVAFVIVKGYIHWTIVFIVLHIITVGMLIAGLSWFLSALSVFVPDTPSITSPISMILMFLSGVFFSIDNMPSHLRIFFNINPLAVIIDQARAAFLYGRIPDFGLLAMIMVLSFCVMLLGYYFFNRTKNAFADVL
jgi:lipopolysaccharide transport system permease protein